MAELPDAPRLDPALLPIFQQYRAANATWNPNFGLWAYLHMRGDPDLAAAFSKLFWPDFVAIEDCVLLAHRYSAANFAHWRAHFPGDSRAVEAMINHTHIWDLFPNRPNDVTFPPALYEYLAQILAVCWRQALAVAFPERRFVVSYATAEEGYGPEIGFYQDRVNR